MDIVDWNPCKCGADHRTRIIGMLNPANYVPAFVSFKENLVNMFN